MVYKDDILDHKYQGDNQIFSLTKIKTRKVSFYTGFTGLNFVIVVESILKKAD